MGRPKKASAEIASIEDAARVMRGLLISEVELEKLQGAMDLARAEATAKFEKPIDAEKAHISDLTRQLKTFYMANHKELEKDGNKSVRLAFGILGRRLGQPVLKPRNRSWTWAAIAIKLRSIYNTQYFNPQPPATVNKDLVRKELNEEQLAACGLKVDQDENFFVETDRTALGVEG